MCVRIELCTMVCVSIYMGVTVSMCISIYIYIYTLACVHICEMCGTFFISD